MQDCKVEGALVVNHKPQSKGKLLKNYPPCQYCGKMDILYVKVGKKQMQGARTTNNLVMKM